MCFPLVKFAGLALISTSAGLQDEAERESRVVSDERLADQLLQDGVKSFVTQWYQLPLWEELRAQTWFLSMLSSRIASNIQGQESLARVLKVSPEYVIAAIVLLPLRT